MGFISLRALPVMGILFLLTSGCMQYAEFEYPFEVLRSNRTSALTLLKSALALDPLSCARRAVLSAKKDGVEVSIPEGREAPPGVDTFCIDSWVNGDVFTGYGLCVYDLDSERTRISVILSYAASSFTPVAIPLPLQKGIQQYVSLTRELFWGNGILTLNRAGYGFFNPRRPCGDY